MPKKIYIFGNPLLEFDNIPLKLLPKLQKKFKDIEFVEADPGDNIMPEDKELTIIDTVPGIKNVTILDDINKLQQEKKYSVHDYDLGTHLLFLNKLGDLEKITIFCIPPDIDEPTAFQELSKKIEQIIK